MTTRRKKFRIIPCQVLIWTTGQLTECYQAEQVTVIRFGSYKYEYISGTDLQISKFHRANCYPTLFLNTTNAYYSVTFPYRVRECNLL